MFVACPDCHRHIHDDAEACPFCAATGTAFRRGLVVAMAAVAVAACDPRPKDIYGGPPAPPAADTSEAQSDEAEPDEADAVDEPAPAESAAPSATNTATKPD